MDQDRIYWRSLDELRNNPEWIKNSGNEFNLPAPEVEGSAETSGDASRRDFLKLAGFSLAAATLAACETPVKKAIPFLAKPEGIDYSQANYYASTYLEDGEYCALLVKTKNGRPIKLEGNRLSSITRGGTSVRVQASLLGLYDNARYAKPQKAGKPTTWADLDAEVAAAVRNAGGKPVVLVTPSIASPSFKAALAEVAARVPGFRHVVYDAVSASGIIKGNQASFGQAVVPSYDFSKASVIVSLDADFLGTWLSPIEYARQFAKGRKLNRRNKTMSRMYAVEPLLSLTGANADERFITKASAVPLFATALHAAIVGGSGATAGVDQKAVDKIAADLKEARGRSLVVSGSSDPQVQELVNSINYSLGNYGGTINLNNPQLTHTGTEAAITALATELEQGAIGAVMFYKTNPVYTHPAGEKIKAALKNTFSLSFASCPNETSAACAWVAPDHHFLESWGDAEPRAGFYSLQQPAISPIFDTRQAPESLLKWAGNNTPYYDFVRAHWRSAIFPTQSEHASFQQFWNYALHDGVYEIGRPSLRGRNFAANGASDPEAVYSYVSLSGVAPAGIAATAGSASAAVQGRYAPSNDLELAIYEKVGIPASGAMTGNPWLLEFPDPITRVTWENYLTVSPSKARELNIILEEGQTSTVKLSTGGKTMELPVVVQPGQEKNTVGLALGFGRSVVGKAGEGRGQNAWPLVTEVGGVPMYTVAKVSIAKAADEYMLGHVQTSHTNAGRPVIQEASYKQYLQNPAAGKEQEAVTAAPGGFANNTPLTPDGKALTQDVTLWKTEVNKRPNHAWGMSIDLNSCIGCGACVVSCNVENNIPVVGKQEVVNRREMHWLRIDRYYSSQKVGHGATREQLETAADNPEVVFQPMLCQHCNNAPCETVCPVLATTHSTEGLNQMTYNRCIGTRYCANNCPYKVRRFNWFSYPTKVLGKGGEDERFPLNPANHMLGRMVLNPDVTVRARGVMEKCSFCVQRIQDGKLNAKKEGRRPIDGEIVTACAQACPTDAIVFGDMNDATSIISQTIDEQYSERAFHVLEEINTRPSVNYLTKIRNKA